MSYLPDKQYFKPMLCHKPTRYESMEEFVNRTMEKSRGPNNKVMGVLATPKIDGIRCITHDRGGMERGQRCITMTRHGRQIPNKYISHRIEHECPPWLDGELVVGDSFQAATSGIMRIAGQPKFTYYVFDCCVNLWTLEYSKRVATLCGMRDNGLLPDFVKVLEPEYCATPQALFEYEEKQVALKAEGVCYHPLWSFYAQKRATRGAPLLCALKRFMDAEAVVTGLEPLWHNDNPIEIGPIGQKERATKGERMVEQAMVGSLVVRDLKTGVVFNVGTGLDSTQRVDWWKKQSLILGKVIKYKFQPHGVKEKPRCPVFLGIRDVNDMDVSATDDQMEMFPHE